MNNSKLIEISGVHKSYALDETRVQALRGVDLTLESGEFTALVGRSGSGKSTLLNIIGCIDEPDDGSIRFGGQELRGMPEGERTLLRNRKIGFIFQNFNLVPVLDVYENIELPLLIRKDLKAADRRERIMSAIRDVELDDRIHNRPGQLSGGQRQRVAIARALVTGPELILADEPTANLDSTTTHKIIDLMLELNEKRRTTFFFCTHDEKLISRVGRTVRIQDGKIAT